MLLFVRTVNLSYFGSIVEDIIELVRSLEDISFC